MEKWGINAFIFVNKVAKKAKKPAKMIAKKKD